MLDGLKGFFANQGPGPDFRDIAGWAGQRGFEFKREREGQGFVVDGTHDGQRWRLEWGPSQRSYIEGQELRLRSELGLPPDLLMLLMARTLMASLEKQAYEEFTQSNQTQLGSATPEETRWLVLFPKIALTSAPALRGRLGGVSNVPHEGPAWLEGPLGRELELAAGSLLQNVPWLLMTLKGRVSLRMAMASVEENDVASALRLFETACTEAVRVAASRGDAAG